LRRCSQQHKLRAIKGQPFLLPWKTFPADYDHHAAQVEAISDALQELMHEGPVKAHEGILEAIEQWYDYHQKEALQWETLRQIMKMDLGNG
jgi:isopentenyl diphosphate isomerase/L-lactate dehydrogenase-like FMN-dependent dehydrogenase